MATPGTFVAGTPLTAADMNLLPGGILGVHQLTTAFATASTHTTYQDDGLTLTLSPPGGRRWRFTLSCGALAVGTTNGTGFRLLGGGSTLREWYIPIEAMSTGAAHSATFVHTVILGSAGATVYKVQVAALNTNAQVQSFGSAAAPRQLIIEDCGVL